MVGCINAAQATSSGDHDAAVLGDTNAYGKEDPITASQGGGRHDQPRSGRHAHADRFVFDGQAG